MDGAGEGGTMARNGPLLTLLAGGALAGVLLVANIVVTGDGPADRPDQELAAAGATPTAVPEPTAAPVPEPAEPVTYVGRVDGGEAAVAIVIDGAEATGYVCDGVIEAWLNGRTGTGELALRGDRGELTARFDRRSASGQVSADGRTWTFTIEQVPPPEGLYRVADSILGGAEVSGGWIVLPDGTQVGLLTVDGRPQPAPMLDPGTGAVRIDGAPATADRVG
jgi:serine/threonine-protein kinase